MSLAEPENTIVTNIDSAKIPRLVAIEGCIGVGKTSLANKLAETFASNIMLEQVDQNPFLTKFYREPRKNALATQLFFLLQRVEQLKTLQKDDLFQTNYVADFLIDKDPLFARVNLTNEEYELYQQVYDSLILEPPKPDLVIYLQAPIDTLIERIQQRGRLFEQTIDARYLEKINRAYSEYFYYYDASPLLIINVAQLDWVNNERDYEQIVEYILQAQTGRHYFNPTFF